LWIDENDSVFNHDEFCRAIGRLVQEASRNLSTISKFSHFTPGFKRAYLVHFNDPGFRTYIDLNDEMILHPSIEDLKFFYCKIKEELMATKYKQISEMTIDDESEDNPFSY
jgi:hypothetical protein